MNLVQSSSSCIGHLHSHMPDFQSLLRNSRVGVGHQTPSVPLDQTSLRMVDQVAW